MFTPHWEYEGVWLFHRVGTLFVVGETCNKQRDVRLAMPYFCMTIVTDLTDIFYRMKAYGGGGGGGGSCNSLHSTGTISARTIKRQLNPQSMRQHSSHCVLAIGFVIQK